MKYGIAINGKFVIINEDENRIRKTVTMCMPQYVTGNIETYEDSEVEQGYDGNWYEKGHAPVIPDEIKLSKAKAERTEAVSAIIVTVDGMEFDGDEKAQERMARTITGAQANGANLTDTAITWVLHDNTVANVTVAQLAQALLLAGQKQTRLWTVPYATEGEGNGHTA